MEKYLIQIVDDAEKYLLKLEHDLKMGFVEYSAAVGSVVGVVEYAKNVVCDVAYSAFVVPSMVINLLERLSCMSMHTNANLRKIMCEE